MGIPKFYRWLSERYPLLNQKLTLTEGPPEMDNLYLDMNGIIHNCTHANRKDIGSVTEEDMMLKVFTYLEKLVQIVRPQKLLFMAIDGVAPRAKMNQQRSRRFKSAMERLKNEEEQRRKGETVPEDAFDSNCITPGTAFMARLGQHLRFFIRRKMAEDPLWQKPTVVFSGHEVPGEGEHKIMEYIRWEKRQHTYQPNQRHCMYGLDADLIMLSLVTHEPHFCLLREVVSYTGMNRGQPAREVLDNPCAESFILFQIGLLREYFELEFGNIKLPFALDIERIIDDYVLMCMLVGNDFLPALPTLDIAEGALNKLMDIYKELLPKLGGYLTYAGDLDRRRLEVLVQRIGQMELETLEERAQDAEFMESKRAKRAARSGGPRMQLNELDAGMRSMAGSHGGVRAAALDQPLEPDTPKSVLGGAPAAQQGPTMMSREARQMMMAGLGDQGLQMWKDRYYNEKLHAVSPEERREVVEHYVAGLHWVLEYYYRGVASWDWYYPYHYAPMASDLVNLESIQVAFAQGNPFRPFEQLLAVLPAASCKLLPPAFRVLMTDPESPIIDFYPATFQVDMEGKRADWEGVVLVPFVDEVRLLQAAQSIRSTLLSPEELARNLLGQIQIYQYSKNASEPKYCTSTMPKHFTDLKVCHSRCSERPPPPPLPVGGKGFTPSLVPGTRIGLQTPTGMPTLKSLQVRPVMRNAGVNVLGTPSRKESVILGLKDLREALGGAVLSAEQVAASGLLGSRAYINWPYLQEARVVRVSDRNGQAMFDKKGGLQVQKWSTHESQRWDVDAGQLASNFLQRSGVDVGKVDLVVSVKVCLGYIRHTDGTIEKTYSKEEVQVPLQAVIRQKPQQAAGGPGAADDVPGFADLQEGTEVVYLGKHHFGCMATVLPDLEKGLAKQGTKPSKRGAAAPNGHYRVRVQPLSDEAGAQALRAAKRVVERFAVKYYSSGEVANRVGISPRLLGRVTGSMWARDGDDRYDLGLVIKTPSKDVCVPGFSQPTEDGNGWVYSAVVITILQEYGKKFPWLWSQLIKSEGEGAGDIRVDQLLPGVRPDQRKDRVREVTDWIKSTPLAKRPLVKLGVKILSDEGVKALTMTAPPAGKPLAPIDYENVPPVLLLLPYTPGPDQVKLSVQGGPFELGDRVVCVSGKGTPPYGLRGTVIGVYEDACEIMFDEDFSGGSDLGGRVGGKCGAFVPKDLLVCINKPVEITHQVPRQQRQAAVSTGPSATKPAASTASGAKPAAPGGAPKPAVDAAVKAAQRAMQQLSVSSGGAAGSPCVPSSVAVTAPVSPPVPSSKLLGAAMRAAVGQSAPPTQAQQQQQAPAAPPSAGNGKDLLRKLTSGRASARTVPAEGPSLAARSGDAGQPGTNSPLDQLKKLVPSARVESPGAPQRQPQAPTQAQPPQPPPGISQYPRDAMRPPLVGMMPPPPPPHMMPVDMHPQRAPYMAGSFFPAHPQQPMFLLPPYPPAGMPMMHPPLPPPMGMMGLGPAVPFFPPYPPSMQPTPAAFPGQPAPLPPAPFQLQPAPPQQPNGSLPQQNGGAPVGNPGVASATAASRAEPAGNGSAVRGGQQPPSPPAATPAAASQAAAPPPSPASRAPALNSHPIIIDTAPAGDESDAGAAPTPGAEPSGKVSGTRSQTTSGGGAAPQQQGERTEAAKPAAANAFGKSARLPEAGGRGFRGRGRPVTSAAPPAAPGSQTGESDSAVTNGAAAGPGRYSLDYANVGPALLRSLQAGGASTGAGASSAPTPVAMALAAAPPPPNPGAALLMQLQRSSTSDVDAALKAQSLDSGTELLRALKRGQQ